MLLLWRKQHFLTWNGSIWVTQPMINLYPNFNLETMKMRTTFAVETCIAKIRKSRRKQISITTNGNHSSSIAKFCPWSLLNLTRISYWTVDKSMSNRSCSLRTCRTICILWISSMLRINLPFHKNHFQVSNWSSWMGRTTWIFMRSWLRRRCWLTRSRRVISGRVESRLSGGWVWGGREQQLSCFLVQKI